MTIKQTDRGLQITGLIETDDIATLLAAANFINEAAMRIRADKTKAPQE